MKIIEAMKKVKAGREKISDLQKKISENCALSSVESSPYKDPEEKIKEWSQSCLDLTQETARLLTAIQRTNLETQVEIKLDSKVVKKSIAEWIWRRREFALNDLTTFRMMTDRGIKEQRSVAPGGSTIDVKIMRFYDPEKRDEKIAAYKAEPHAIDSALEVANASTDLIE